MRRPRDELRLLSDRIFAGPSGFRSEYLDFRRGIRVGHLEPQDRITQILKRALSERHGVNMVCDRWGRGVHWQWICWVPEPNRRAKPLSSGYNFGSTKFFVAIDREDRVFQSGMQVERAPKRPAGDDLVLAKDWDWHVVLRALRGKELPRALGRLLREGFRLRVGPFDDLTELGRRDWDPTACRKLAEGIAPGAWGGLQIFWPMTAEEVASTPGPELIEAMLAAFDELAPAMNLCMYQPCLRERG